jgi:hypothetical protein
LRGERQAAEQAEGQALVALGNAAAAIVLQDAAALADELLTLQEQAKSIRHRLLSIPNWQAAPQVTIAIRQALNAAVSDLAYDPALAADWQAKRQVLIDGTHDAGSVLHDLL